MSQSKAPKVRATLFCILVGIVLAVVAVVTDHWAVLSPEVGQHNATCEAAHFGLWRICIKRLFVSSSRDKSCGPISLPGEKNCSYFRHFNPGESSEIFEVTTQKEYSISAAAIAIFSLGFQIMGTILVLLSFRKKRDYLLRPASMFYAFAGHAAVGEAHDRQRAHGVDRALLLLVLRLRLRRLCPPLPRRPRPPALLPASDAPEPLGVLHGRRARALALLGPTDPPPRTPLWKPSPAQKF
nr:voltage-dependent calcium channel gamma-1 subunit isoform X1 [Manis javanica]